MASITLQAPSNKIPGLAAAFEAHFARTEDETIQPGDSDLEQMTKHLKFIKRRLVYFCKNEDFSYRRDQAAAEVESDDGLIGGN